MQRNTPPQKYQHQEREIYWSQKWQQSGIYNYNPNESRENTFVIDTPPPTVSGSLHVGHVFSYTQTDVIARYQRMMGKNIFYPVGWDDNGLPTERRVQNYYAIRCDPKLKYDTDWKIPEKQAEKGQKPLEVSRRNFIEACGALTAEDEKAYKALWTQLGLSFDWSLEYATIDKHCQRTSQQSFLKLAESGHAYSVDSPTLWDVDFRSAVAQAEVEDREMPGAYHDLKFHIEGGEESFIISTTRPELLAACIAIVAHPDDERYKHLFGKNAVTPVFRAVVPVRAAEIADPEKGTGIMMICTFGDINDVEWWKKSGLPLKQIIGKDGRLLNVEFGKAPFLSLDAESANQSYANIAGCKIPEAQKRMVEMLGKENSQAYGTEAALQAEPKKITHPVKFYEKGDRPLEYVPTRQWFVNILNHKQQLLELGRQIRWEPEHMRHRYESWVNGLNQDWCYSRQRYFGVPFPVWYKLDANGQPDFDNPIFPDYNRLPVDPLADAPDEFDESQRDQPNGFCGDPDVMDTWSTSSLTPQIASKWLDDPERHARLFPADMRPQAHEIIRTWAFYTIVKAYFHEKTIPWKNIAISGWILDPERKKMSKSKGNTITPETLMKEYSADGVRYWAARAKLGVDTAFDVGVLKIGLKLATKLLNAGKFVYAQIERACPAPFSLKPEQITEQLDLAWIERMRQVVTKAGNAHQQMDYASALMLSEELFWDFCDNYLELAKVRSYKDINEAGTISALATLQTSLNIFIRLFAPVLPYMTEELWSWCFSQQDDSVHTCKWPSETELDAVKRPQNANSYLLAVKTTSLIRGAKSEAQVGQKTQVKLLTISANQAAIDGIKNVARDIMDCGNLLDGALRFEPDAELKEHDINANVELVASEDVLTTGQL